MNKSQIKEIIELKQGVLGIELGSTRIKAVVINDEGETLAIGVHDWENTLVNEIWTYNLDKIHTGIRKCYASLRNEIEKEYGITPKGFKAMGISGMMHGYMAFDKGGNLLAPFQTWRNSNTQKAADILTERFNYNIPLRWSIAHLYQRILDGEEHVKNLDYITTLSGYIHRKLTGKKAIGIGDGSGMFPINSEIMDYDKDMVQSFDNLIADQGYSWKLMDVLPQIKVAGQMAGKLTKEGAEFLDESGALEAGIPLCPPEGDAGTGMVATNAVEQRTGNVSVGTSIFAMIVLEKKLQKLHREIDMVTTPDGSPVAMSHANNGTSDLNSWVKLFEEFSLLMGLKPSKNELFEKLYKNSLTGDVDGGGLLAYGYLSGEGITMVNEGRPLFARTPNSNFSLANFIKVHLYTSLSAVKIGLDILTEEEGIKLDKIMGHGGFFKTKEVGQRCLSSAVEAPVAVMETASEGGSWGVALLAAYMIEKNGYGKIKNFENITLGSYLEEYIFGNAKGSIIKATEEEIKGFSEFVKRYKAGLAVEKSAIEAMKW